MHVSKKDRENCNRTEKMTCLSSFCSFADVSQSYDNRTEDRTFDLLV